MLKRLLAAAVILLVTDIAAAQPNLTYSFLRDNQGRPSFGIGVRPVVTPEMGVPIGTPFFDRSTNALYYWSGTAWTEAGIGDFVVPEAANTLALRNGTNAQTFNIYNTADGSPGSNYERMRIGFESNQAIISVEKGGTGSNRILVISASQVNLPYTVVPPVHDGGTLGGSLGTYSWQSTYLTRSIQGSKTKALTEGAATAVTQIAVPQTAGTNFADATVQWAVYASDGTDSQVRKGSTYLAAVNKAGTETCTVGDVGTTQVAVSAGTLTCTTSCITGLTDAVQFALNCTSSLTQTTLNALARLDMMEPNTVTPQ